MISIPYLLYWDAFHFKLFSDNYSNRSSDWGDFGNFINGVTVPLITIVGLLLSYFVYIASSRNIERQIMSQKPLLYLSYEDYKNHITIRIVNKGIGVLIVTNYYLLHDESGEITKGFYQLLTDISNKNIKATSNEKGLILSPGEERILLDVDKAKEECLSFIREKCKHLIVFVEYKDIYNNHLPKYSKSLEWLGRDDKDFLPKHD